MAFLHPRSKSLANVMLRSLDSAPVIRTFSRGIASHMGEMRKNIRGSEPIGVVPYSKCPCN